VNFLKAKLQRAPPGQGDFDSVEQKIVLNSKVVDGQVAVWHQNL
jgi:hypothetical protein